uniref:Uncharacterized protein n=1 Tax=Sciurus vulgaris TaxID=55149 RepID=A0A8D2BBR6_SCIVU
MGGHGGSGSGSGCGRRRSHVKEADGAAPRGRWTSCRMHGGAFPHKHSPQGLQGARAEERRPDSTDGWNICLRTQTKWRWSRQWHTELAKDGGQIKWGWLSRSGPGTKATVKGWRLWLSHSQVPGVVTSSGTPIGRGNLRALTLEASLGQVWPPVPWSCVLGTATSSSAFVWKNGMGGAALG